MYEKGLAPLWAVNERTLIFDPTSGRQVAFLDGRVVLPVGSEIELYDAEQHAHGTATVVKVRLLNGTSKVPNQVCLDVQVDDRWWDAHPFAAE